MTDVSRSAPRQTGAPLSQTPASSALREPAVLPPALLKDEAKRTSQRPLCGSAFGFDVRIVLHDVAAAPSVAGSVELQPREASERRAASECDSESVTACYPHGIAFQINDAEGVFHGERVSPGLVDLPPAETWASAEPTEETA